MLKVHSVQMIFIQSTVACAERVFEVLDEDEEISNSSDAVIVEQPKGNAVHADHFIRTLSEGYDMCEVYRAK